MIGHGIAGWTNAQSLSSPTSRWGDTASHYWGIPTIRRQTLESPVRNERRTPGSGTGVGETTVGNHGIGAPTPCSLAPYPSRNKAQAAA
jgi:hypothetical protein